MSTPLQSSAKHPTPSQPAATPRSVPSPALHRAHAAPTARTPQPPIKGGTPMAISLSQASAASGVKLEASPAPFGFGASPIMPGGTPMEMLEMPLKKDEDGERRRRVRGILDRLVAKGGMGRVCDEGVRRVGRWAGFDVEIENKFAAKEWEGNRPVVVAGRNAVLIDLAFKQGKVGKVEVTFSSEDEGVAALQEGAAAVLREDLIKERLDGFAANLQALGRLDRLSSSSVNCVEAVAGVHAGLKRLYEHELAGLGDEDGDRAAKRVMREKSGRPAMHQHGRVGLGLDYWSENKVTTDAKTKEATASEEIYSLEVTVESNARNAIPPIRISKDWLGKDVVRPADSTDEPADLAQLYTGLDWREPAPIPAAAKDPDAMADDFAATTSVDVRFVAHLHPPIVMPYTVATQVLQLTGLPSTVPVTQSSYSALVLGPSAPTTVTRHVFVTGPDQDKDVAQTISLFDPKPELATTLSSIPFSHPMHLVLALPLLRQWAQLGHILRSTFTAGGASARAANPAKLTLDALLSQQSPGSKMLDISLSTAGEPVLTLFAPGDEARPLSVRVGQNGRVSVQSRGEADDVLAKGLEEVGDLGIWSEWVAKRGWQGTAMEGAGDVAMDGQVDAVMSGSDMGGETVQAGDEDEGGLFGDD